jgi:phosphoglycerate dehydrogenase-like enzyme
LVILRFERKEKEIESKGKNESTLDGRLPSMSRPSTLVCAGRELFQSFFPMAQAKRLSEVCDWRLDGSRDVKRLRKRLATTEVLITTWDSPNFSEDLLELAPQLRLITHCGGEVKSRFARPLFEKLTITNAADPMARATAEMGAAFLLYGARNIDYYRGALRQRSNHIYEELHLHGNVEGLAGCEVAMIGLGRIGRALIDLMRGFHLDWIVYDPYAPRDLPTNYPVRFVELDDLLPRATLLVLTAALTDETRGLLNRKRLAALPRNAFIVNIARGGLVDLDALTEEVKRGRLRCAIDVTDPVEPLPIRHPIRRLPGAMVTPHIAASKRKVREQIADVVLDDIENFFAGRAVKNQVTTAMLDRMT